MAMKVMLLIAEIIMLIKMVRAVDKGMTIPVFTNGFVLFTLALAVNTLC